MDSTELLLAAEVRKVALQIRHERWIAFAAAADIRKEGGRNLLQFDQMKRRWELEHPISHYISDAAAQLNNVALQLKAIKKDNY